MNVFLKYFFGSITSLVFFANCTQNDKTEETNNIQTKKLVYPILPPTTLTDKEKLTIKNAVQLFYDSTLALSGFNGGILIAKGGNIVYEKYRGSINLNGVDSLTAATPLHIASVSKTFTAMAILKLHEQGKLGIDDSITKYFPSFNYDGVTIKSLLTHRSGLPNYLYFMDKVGWPKDSVMQNNDVLDWMISKKNNIEDIATANTNFNYCNTNYVLLALIIEKVTGLPYPTYMQQNIFDAMGMQHSFVHHHNDGKTVSKSFDWKSREIINNNLDETYGDKNIYSTVQDLLKWDRVLRDSIFLTPASKILAYTPYSNEKPGIKNYGFGWRMDNYPDGKKIIFHNGWWHGNNAAFIRLIDEDVTIIALSNRFARQVYGTKVLVNIFGHYFDTETEEGENTTPSNIPETFPLQNKKGKQLPNGAFEDMYKKEK